MKTAATRGTLGTFLSFGAFRKHSLLWLAALGLLMATLLAACGGGGVVPGSGVEQRPLSTEFTSRKAVSYSPFRTASRDTEEITEAMVKQDLELVVAAGYGVIRLFDSSDQVAKLTLEVIKKNDLDLKVMLGMYVNPSAEAGNQAELDRGIALANAYPKIVHALSVGNETMVSWSFVPQEPGTMAAYIRKVRAATKQPVTTDDNWAFFASAQDVRPPLQVLNTIDFVSMHTYPLLDTIFSPGLWDWQQTDVPATERAAAMMDAAIASAQREYQAVRDNLDTLGFKGMPIVVGETGWKAEPAGGETQRAHPVNQKLYMDRLTTWKASAGGPANIFYFEAFDEPWKRGDDKWGLFNVARQARYVIQDKFPQSQWEPGVYTDANAVYYIPLDGNPTITADRYTLFADVAVADEALPAEALIWNAWDGGVTASGADLASDAAVGDGPNSFAISPTPQVWGWGMTRALTLTAEDLSNFEASGTLNFSIKTTYAGSLEVGFLTGNTTSGTAYDVYMKLDPGKYGYKNDGQWHNVSIPIKDITPSGAMAFGMTDPTLSKLDLTKVTNPFVIADRYTVTGKAEGANVRTQILIDNVYWSR
jgi:exo-beta-1,3-glucanase (GH17 family)